MNPPALLTEVPWETRNLGIQSYALNASALAGHGASTLAALLKDAAEAHGGIFVQAKLEPDHASLSPLISSAGFYFVELALTPHLNIRNNPLLADFERDPAAFLRGRFAVADLRFGPMDKADASQSQAVRDIAGSSFTDDRFHTDPHCDPLVADRRYQLWVDQMLSDESHQFYTMHHKGQVIAFMIQKDTTLPLAGFSQAYTRSGLGDYFWLSTLLAMQKQGHSKVSTGISTNNTAVLNLYSRMGFRFRNPTAVYHYWSTPETKGSA